jgi:hypothetical protein
MSHIPVRFVLSADSKIKLIQEIINATIAKRNFIEI